MDWARASEQGDRTTMNKKAMHYRRHVNVRRLYEELCFFLRQEKRCSSQPKQRKSYSRFMAKREATQEIGEYDDENR
jgi:hypothetical protein